MKPQTSEVFLEEVRTIGLFKKTSEVYLKFTAQPTQQNPTRSFYIAL